MTKRECLQRNLRRLVTSNGYTWTKGTPSITPRQLLRIEQGISDVTIGKLEALANDLGVPFEDFFEE